ncbi:hypothetical protein EMCRGX_G022834 [Ephydatia muelleri]
MRSKGNVLSTLVAPTILTAMMNVEGGPANRIDPLSVGIQCAEATPLSDKLQSVWLNSCTRVTCRFGAPEIVIPDQGSLRNNKKLYLITKTEHRLSSVYHPQTNGLTEHTLSRCLAKMVNEDQKTGMSKLKQFSWATGILPSFKKDFSIFFAVSKGDAPSH